MPATDGRESWLEFERLTTLNRALLNLQCSPELVLDVIHNPLNHYFPIRISRRRSSNKPRVVYRTSIGLRRLHRTIALGLSPYIQKLPDGVQGFRKDCNIITNAVIHCGRPEVVTADIQDFFGSITTRMVQQLFEELGASFQVSLMLARICTLSNSLPQGGRASPSIANLVATSLDVAITSSFPDLEYSRYADDIALSGSGCPSYEQLAELFNQNGFTLKPNSYKLVESGRGQYVTGLNVDGMFPKAPRKVRRIIERALHISSNYSVEDFLYSQYKVYPTTRQVTSFRRHLLGLVSSYGAVDQVLYNQWLD
jgi:hypothetical protein